MTDDRPNREDRNRRTAFAPRPAGAKRGAPCAPLHWRKTSARSAFGLEGGRYKPLTDSDLAQVHEAVLTVLETVGFANAIPSCLAALTRAGAIHGADGRIRFPARPGVDTIKRAARNFTLCGQDPRHDMLIQGKRVHYGTAGAAVHLVDVEKREYRRSLLQDIYDAARLVDGLDNIHFFQRPMVPRDIPDPLDMDFNTLYACVTGTSKHVGTSFTVRDNVGPALEMLYMIAGGEENFRARPFVSNSNCFVVPPMKFAEDACGVLEACVEGGIRSCYSRRAKPAPRRRRLSPARSCKPWRKCWPASSTSTPSNPAIRRSSAPGLSSPTCAPARCPAARPSRRC